VRIVPAAGHCELLLEDEAAANIRQSTRGAWGEGSRRREKGRRERGETPSLLHLYSHLTPASSVGREDVCATHRRLKTKIPGATGTRGERRGIEEKKKEKNGHLLLIYFCSVEPSDESRIPH